MLRQTPPHSPDATQLTSPPIPVEESKTPPPIKTNRDQDQYAVIGQNGDLERYSPTLSEDSSTNGELPLPKSIIDKEVKVSAEESLDAIIVAKKAELALLQAEHLKLTVDYDLLRIENLRLQGSLEKEKEQNIQLNSDIERAKHNLDSLDQEKHELEDKLKKLEKITTELKRNLQSVSYAAAAKRPFLSSPHSGTKVEPKPEDSALSSRRGR